MSQPAIDLTTMIDTGLEQLIFLAIIALVIIGIGNYAFKRWVAPFLTAKSAQNMDNHHLHAREVCQKAEETGTGMDILLRNLDYQFSHVITIDPKKESTSCLKQ